MGDSPHSLFFEFQELSITIADRFHITPFELYKQDCGEVIDLINYFLEKSEAEEKKPKPPAAEDGFWDF